MTYKGTRAALATKHGKEEAIAGPLRERASIEVIVAQGIDTDELGTFTGEVERVGNMLETAITKARRGASLLGTPFSIASEGSFGPHPSTPILAAGFELLVFVDDEAGVVIREERMEKETNYSHLVVAGVDETSGWLTQIGFPDHAVIVRPNHGDAKRVTAKGLTDLTAVARAITAALHVSEDGRARLETDMRAHLNPTRMRSIGRLAASLGDRLARPCPSCSAPGFGCTGVIRGLRCGSCGTPTEWVKVERWTCARCPHAEDRPRPDDLTEADPEHCPRCNP